MHPGAESNAQSGALLRYLRYLPTQPALLSRLGSLMRLDSVTASELSRLIGAPGCQVLPTPELLTCQPVTCYHQLPGYLQKIRPDRQCT